MSKVAQLVICSLYKYKDMNLNPYYIYVLKTVKFGLVHMKLQL